MKKIFLTTVLILTALFLSYAQSDEKYEAIGLTIKIGDTITIGVPSVYDFGYIRERDQYGEYIPVKKTRNLLGYIGIVNNINVTDASIREKFKDYGTEQYPRIISFIIAGNTFYAAIDNALKVGEFIVKIKEFPNSERMTIDHNETAFVYFTKNANISTDSISEEYLSRYMSNLYIKSHNDEFEYGSALNTAKNQLLENRKR